MLGDRVPARPARLATSLFYAGVPVGFGLSFALAGFVGPRLGWRACFLALGLAGLAAVGLVWRMADPPRRGAARRDGRRRAGPRRHDREPCSAPSPPSRPSRSCSGATLLVYASASSQHLRSPGWSRSAASPTARGVLSAAVVLGRRARRQPRHRRLTDAARAAGTPARGSWLRRPRGRRRSPRPRPSTCCRPDSPLFYAVLARRPGVDARLVRPAAGRGPRDGAPGAAGHRDRLRPDRPTSRGSSLGPYVTGLVGDRASLTPGPPLRAWPPARPASRSSPSPPRRGQVLNLESRPATPHIQDLTPACYAPRTLQEGRWRDARDGSGSS
jgi:hypothetical protein